VSNPPSAQGILLQREQRKLPAVRLGTTMCSPKNNSQGNGHPKEPLNSVPSSPHIRNGANDGHGASIQGPVVQFVGAKLLSSVPYRFH
jgi:hypothetical protein